MTNWTINAINTINHNDVEYIYVPFNYALFRDKSNQTHRQFEKIITRQGETKPCFLFARLAQLGEHLPYKQRVVGSSPTGCTSMGGYASGSKQAVCKTVASGFVSSTLTPPTI